MNCAAQKFIYAFIYGKIDVTNELWVRRCVCKYELFVLCCACSIRTSNMGLKVRLFLSSLFIVLRETEKFLLSPLPLSLVNWWRMNTTQFSLFLLSRVSCGAIHRWCTQRSSVVNPKMLRKNRTSNDKNQSHANVIEFVLIFLCRSHSGIMAC